MSEMIKTKSFELAANLKGKPDSEKLALLLPGRLDTKDYAHMKSHVEFLAKKGFLAVSFDPPGTWESPGDIKIYTMTNYLKAINELIEHFGNKPTVLMGHSRGGSMAMLAGTRNNLVTHIIAAMSNAAASKIEGKVGDGCEISYRDVPSGGKKRFELPLSFFKDAMQYNLLEALPKCAKPKLYFLGSKDKIVPPEIVRKNYEKSAEPKKLYAVNSEHDYRFHPEIIREINLVVGEFLDRNRA